MYFPLFDKTPVTLDRSLKQRLLAISGMTFFKDYRHYMSSLNADYAVGSPTAAYTAARSVVAPATYVDGAGVVQLLTTADARRRQGGYYNDTGFHAQSGEMIEAAGTNMLMDSYFADGTTTYWIANGTATVTNDNTYVNRYLGGNTQKVVSAAQYDGVITAVAKRPSLTTAKKNTVSAIVQGTGTAMDYFKCVGGATQYGTPVTLLGNDTPIKISQTFTADATAAADIGVVSNDGASTFWVNTIQNEGGAVDASYATSFIPTTIAALTRGAEVLKYNTSNNINNTSASIFIKVSSLFTTLPNNGNTFSYLTTDADVTFFGIKNITGTPVIRLRPNETDSSGTSVQTGNPIINTSIIWAGVFYGATEDINVRLYKDGVSVGTNSTNYTNPDYGTSIYIGSRSGLDAWGDAIIQSVAIYNRVLSAAEVLSVTNILNSGGL